MNSELELQTDELTATDVREINNLIAEYVLSVDARDVDRFRELWIEDAVLRANRDHVGLGVPLHGRDAIVEAFAGYFARRAEQAPGTFVRHLCTHSRIDVADGRVTATTGMLSVHQKLAGDAIDIRPSRTGVYYDRIVRDAGRWRFAERTIAWDPPEREGVRLPVALYGPVAGE